MPCSQHSIGGILHDQIRRLVVDAKVVDSNDMRMVQVCDRASLAAERLLVCRFHLDMQNLDGSGSLQIVMLAQVDSSKRPLSEQTEQAVIAKLLSHTISHRRGRFPRTDDACTQREMSSETHTMHYSEFHAPQSTRARLLR